MSVNMTRFTFEKLKIYLDLDEHAKAIEALAEITQLKNFETKIEYSDIENIVLLKTHYTKKQREEQLKYINLLLKSENYNRHKFKHIIDEYAVMIQSEFYEEIESFIDSVNKIVQNLDEKHYMLLIHLTKVLASLYTLLYQNFSYNKSKYLELAYMNLQKGIKLCLKHLDTCNVIRLKFFYSLCKFNAYEMKDGYRTYLMAGRLINEAKEYYKNGQEEPPENSKVLDKIFDLQQTLVNEYEVSSETFYNNRK